MAQINGKTAKILLWRDRSLFEIEVCVFEITISGAISKLSECYV